MQLGFWEISLPEMGPRITANSCQPDRALKVPESQPRQPRSRRQASFRRPSSEHFEVQKGVFGPLPRKVHILTTILTTRSTFRWVFGPLSQNARFFTTILTTRSTFGPHAAPTLLEGPEGLTTVCKALTTGNGPKSERPCRCVKLTKLFVIFGCFVNSGTQRQYFGGKQTKTVKTYGK